MCVCVRGIELQVLQHMEDVKVREMQIFDYKKKIAEAETKLKQQQNLYEAVRSDRNLYSKNLIESQVYYTRSNSAGQIASDTVDTGGVKSSYTYPDSVYAILSYRRLLQKPITIVVCIKEHSL